MTRRRVPETFDPDAVLKWYLTTPKYENLREELARCKTIKQLHDLARQRVPPRLIGRVGGGAGNGSTIDNNRRALDRLQFTPGVMVDTSNIDTSTVIFGETLQQPFGFGAAGKQRWNHPSGEIAAGLAAKVGNILIVLSGVATTGPEELRAKLGDANIWAQFYWFKPRPGQDKEAHRAATLAHLRRLELAGIKTLEFTVDASTPAERPLENRSQKLAVGRIEHLAELARYPKWSWDMALAGKQKIATLPPDWEDLESDPQPNFDDSLIWEDFKWLRKHWNGKLVMKGIMRGEDAKRAVEAGADGVHISNHGGRQQEDVIGTMDVLAEVAEAARSVKKDVVILVDGGFESGKDIVKGIARGANLVLPVRAYLWGQLAGGFLGILRAREILETGVVATMKQIHCPDIATLGNGTYVTLPGLGVGLN